MSYRREQVINVADVRAPMQPEAIASGARLMAEKAHWLGPDVWLTVIVAPALQWRAVEG